MTFAEVKARCTKRSPVESRTVPLIIWRRVSIYLTYVFVRLGVAPDVVTFLSFGAILLGAILFVIGQPLWGAAGFAAFQVLDCSDGEVARWVGPSKYGGYLDSFGADLFYTLGPISIGYYLFSDGAAYWGLQPGHFLAIGGGVSASFMFYRVISSKVMLFRFRFVATSPSEGLESAPQETKVGGVGRLVRLYRNEVMRASLFAEPGMALIFLVLAAAQVPEYTGAYLLVLLIYNAGYAVLTLLSAYRTFTQLGR